MLVEREILDAKKCIDGTYGRFLLEPRLTRQNWVSTDEGQPDTECFLSCNQDDFCLSHPHSAKVFCFAPVKISSTKTLIKGKFNKRTIKTTWPNFLALFLSLYIFEEMGSNGNWHTLECNESLSLICILYSQLIAIKKRKKCYCFGKLDSYSAVFLNLSTFARVSSTWLRKIIETWPSDQTRPSVNYAKDWLDQRLPSPGLAWFGKINIPMTCSQPTFDLCARHFWHGDDQPTKPALDHSFAIYFPPLFSSPPSSSSARQRPPPPLQVCLPDLA